RGNGGTPIRTLTLPRTGPHAALHEEVALGRRLFHAVGDPRVSADGRACASCHPDGRDDGLVWRTPEGPRQTLMLAGRVGGPAPYGWTRDDRTLATYIQGTVMRLRGRDLAEMDADALAAYVLSLRP